MPTRYLSVSAERAEADQLIACKHGVKSGFWLQQPLGVCVGHVVAVIRRGVSPGANVECVLPTQRGDLHRRTRPCQRVVCWTRVWAHGLKPSAEIHRVPRPNAAFRAASPPLLDAKRGVGNGAVTSPNPWSPPYAGVRATGGSRASPRWRPLLQVICRLPTTTHNRSFSADRLELARRPCRHARRHVRPPAQRFRREF